MCRAKAASAGFAVGSAGPIEQTRKPACDHIAVKNAVSLFNQLDKFQLRMTRQLVNR